ncbi:MAG: hypothetical protein JKX71_14265 [Amylibacter sp.]|nr:hypothetical protein [Amylibacter sp.]
MENESDNSTSLNRVVEAITWHGIGLTVIHKINYFEGIDHIEIHSENRVPFPISETGYRSHFLHFGGLQEHTNAVEYVLACLEHEAKSKVWKAQEIASRQGNLFDL